MTPDIELDLTVQVSAAEWAYSQRRAAYLATLLIRLLRDEGDLQEWFTSDDLASLQLPGLLISPASITRKASAGRWRRRRVRRGNGHRYVYHVASLPAPSFDALLGRLMDLPDEETDPLDVASITPPPAPERALPFNTAPSWVLPLMRLMKVAGGDLATAWRSLPAALPTGVELPTVEEAATVLIRFGLAE